MDFPKGMMDRIKWSYSLNRDKPMSLRNTNFPIVTLVGSTRFPELFEEANKELTRLGWIVFSVTEYGHLNGMDMSGPIKKQLDMLYLKKIDLSDAIFVLNKDQYIGLGAWDEICFAISRRKTIYFLERLNDTCREYFKKVTQLEGIHYLSGEGLREFYKEGL